MTIRMEPHRIEVPYNDGVVIVFGEAYDQPVNGFNYSVDTESMKWAPPKESVAITENDRGKVV
jgi:hypothetical protein